LIVSHTRRFIFVKSAKTAGTSFEAALSNFCGGSDIVTPLGDYGFNKDETGRWVHRPMNSEGFEQHDWASTIREKIGPEPWNAYLKFSIVRNPWDRVVSLFTWKARKDPTFRDGLGRAAQSDGREGELRYIRSRFADFVTGDWQTNDRFYYVDGQYCIDHMLRYERLQDDTSVLCGRLGLPDIELPRLKAGFRPGEFHYSEYYDERSVAHVAERHRRDIDRFGYEFERR
jgi:hypothetical protein